MTDVTRDLVSEAVEDIERPSRIFDEHAIQRVVVILGSGRDTPLTLRYRNDAFEIASRVTAWSRNQSPGDRLWVCSGGKSGVMTAVSEGVVSEGGLPLGFGFDLEDRTTNRFQSPGTTHLFWFPGLRNHWLFQKMVALIAFPGGIGTLTEVYDALLHSQLSLSSRVPIFLYGRDFWSRHVRLDELVTSGLASASDIGTIDYVDTPDPILHHLFNAAP